MRPGVITAFTSELNERSTALRVIEDRWIESNERDRLFYTLSLEFRSVSGATKSAARWNRCFDGSAKLAEHSVIPATVKEGVLCL